MKIEIHGGQLRNKGAQKMLRTTIEKLSENFNNAEMYCDSVCGNKEELGHLGLKTFITSRGWMGGRMFSIKFFLQKTLGIFFRENSVNKMDALIDISGFAYSDQWGERPARDASKLVRYYRSRNKPVIFLPQAFGPFENNKLKIHMLEIISGSNLIYARDYSSFTHLKQLTNSNIIKFCPDITFGFSNENLKMISQTKKIALIPNTRVVSSKLFKVTDSYVNELENIVNGITADKIDILIHDDSGEDIALVKNSRVLSACNIIEINDALLLKSEIKNYRFVIGSRYHGLVAAISQCIPVISIGWSHKYDELMNYSGQSEFNYSNKNNDISKMVKSLTDKKNHTKVSLQLQKINANTSKSLAMMWNEVVDLLNE